MINDNNRAKNINSTVLKTVSCLMNLILTPKTFFKTMDYGRTPQYFHTC